MWTGDGKVFFFHPVTKTSIWERPKELEDNTLVDDILKKGPALLPDKEKSSSATDSEMNDASDNQRNKGKVMFFGFFLPYIHMTASAYIIRLLITLALGMCYCENGCFYPFICTSVHLLSSQIQAVVYSPLPF